MVTTAQVDGFIPRMRGKKWFFGPDALGENSRNLLVNSKLSRGRLMSIERTGQK
jgi:hypothetical protein